MAPAGDRRQTKGRTTLATRRTPVSPPVITRPQPGVTVHEWQHQIMHRCVTAYYAMPARQRAQRRSAFMRARRIALRHLSQFHSHRRFSAVVRLHDLVRLHDHLHAKEDG